MDDLRPNDLRPNDLRRNDLRRAVATAADALAPHTAADWSVRARDLEWSCSETLDHVITSLLWYAGNLATLATRRPGTVRDRDPNASTEHLLEALVLSGHILARVAEATPPGGRGYHRMGMADATGFVAMGCDETLVHTGDICAGLGVRFDPPGDLCAALVARLFPWAPEHDDPWERLLWCNGRIALPGHQRLGREWGWWSAPLDEWDGAVRTDPLAGN
jgi:uncharacterized protein (TIGR03083 family)